MGLPRVGILAAPGIDPFLYATPHSVFGVDIRGSLFEVKAATEDDRPLKLGSRFVVSPAARLDDLASMDVIVIPGWGDFETRPSPRLKTLLREARGAGGVVAGLCFGAYALAYAGLLDGKRATTYWLAEKDFKKRFPAIELNDNSLYADEDGIITSAGASAAIDCRVYIVKKFYGYKTANAVARVLVSSPRREGGQAQFIDSPAASAEEPLVSRIMEFIAANLRSAYTLAELAEKFCLSRRTLIRRFEVQAGVSVKKWTFNLRLQKCCEALEDGDLSIERIAEETGFGSPERLRYHFCRRYGLSPSAWRAKFFNGARPCGI